MHAHITTHFDLSLFLFVSFLSLLNNYIGSGNQTKTTQQYTLYLPDFPSRYRIMSLSFSTNPSSNRSLKHFSDEVVARSIYTRHRDGKRIKFDIDNYIALVDSIITTADRITKVSIFVYYLLFHLHFPQFMYFLYNQL